MSEDLNNSAVIKIVRNHEKEYGELDAKYKVLGKKLLRCKKLYADLLDEKTKVDVQNRDLKRMVKQWEKENGVLLESLDACQRELTDK